MVFEAILIGLLVIGILFAVGGLCCAYGLFLERKGWF
jgi:hypothetical protein